MAQSRKALKLFGGLVLAVLACTILLRFADGPILVFPGGPLQSGERVEGRPR